MRAVSLAPIKTSTYRWGKGADVLGQQLVRVRDVQRNVADVGKHALKAGGNLRRRHGDRLAEVLQQLQQALALD